MIRINNIKKSKKVLLLVLILSVIAVNLIGCSNKTPELENNNPEVIEPKDETKNIEEGYYGEWIIDSVQAYGVGTYSGEDAESLIGKVLIFTDKEANYFTDELSDIEKLATNPTYTEKVLEESTFVENYRIPLYNLGIDDNKITEVSVSDSNGNVAIFFIKDDNTLIIYGGGTYFELNRQHSK